MKIENKPYTTKHFKQKSLDQVQSNKGCSAKTFDELPTEIARHVLTFVSAPDLVRLSTSSKEGQKIGLKAAEVRIKEIPTSSGEGVFKQLYNEEIRTLFLKKIEPFKKSNLDVYNQLIQLFNNDINLTTLNLSDKNIGNDGAVAIAIALRSNNNLQRLVLSRNKISNDGALALANALQKILLCGNWI